MRPRRGLALAAGSFAAVLLLAALAAAMLMQPERLARLVLGTVGDGLGLEIGFEGPARYRLRGTPLLEVRDLSVRVPGDGEPVLRAARALVSLPWSTVRDRPAPLVLERIELDAPTIDLPRLQAWLATRPPGPGALPTLSRGASVRDGRVIAPGWELRELELDLPRFAADRPLAAHARGQLALTPPLRIAFDLRLAATRPADGAGASARGRLRVEHAGWALPAFVTASGPLHSGDGSLRIAPLRFGASAEFQGEGRPIPFALGLHGPLRLRDGVWTLAPAGAALRGDGQSSRPADDDGDDLVPAIDAQGRIAAGPALLIELEGAMRRWPQGWPALPPPLDDSGSAVDIALRYAGASDLSGPLVLRMARGEARAEGGGRIFEILDWLEAAAVDTPLPPLRATAHAPRIELPGAVLEGVEIDIEPDDGQ